MTPDDAGPSGFFEVDDVDEFWQALPESVTKVTPPQDLDPIGDILRAFGDFRPARADR